MKTICPVCPSDNVATLLAGMARTVFQGRRPGESAGCLQVQVRVDATIAFPVVISALTADGTERAKRRRGKKMVVFRQGID